MKIYSFNVNGLRAIMKKDFLSWVDSVKPDILCLQETKLSDKDFSIELPGYHQYYSCAQKKGYSGTHRASRLSSVLFMCTEEGIQRNGDILKNRACLGHGRNRRC